MPDLTETVVFMGLGRIFQIWEPAAAERRRAEARERARAHGFTLPGNGRAMSHPMPAHVPVMLSEVVGLLAPRDGGVYLDGTFGGGGYATAFLEAAPCTVWAIDRDPEAIARGASLAARFPGRLHLIHGQFGDMLDLLAEHGVTALDGVVLDLGVSSFQLDDPARGFSFRGDGPLDMRMSRSGPTAADLVNTLPERELADLLFELGEERASRRIARAIVAARAEAPIVTTARLAAHHPRRAAAGSLRHRSRDPQLPGAAHPGERRTRRDRAGAGAGQPAAGARRSPGRGVVPFAGGPHRQALHGRCGRPRAGAVAPRSARACRRVRRRASAC